MILPDSMNKIRVTLHHENNADLITEQTHDEYQADRLGRPNLVVKLTEVALKNAGQELRDVKDQCAVRVYVMAAVLFALEAELESSETALQHEIDRFQLQPIPKQSEQHTSIPGAYLSA